MLPSYQGLVPWQEPPPHVPPYPVASNLAPSGLTPVPTVPSTAPGEVGELREELRRLILEELETIIRG